MYMKKLLFVLFAMAVLFISCEPDRMAMQKGVVVKSEVNESYGYKYCVRVRNISKKGLYIGYYILYTDENYRVGDTIKIK